MAMQKLQQRSWFDFAPDDELELSSAIKG